MPEHPEHHEGEKRAELFAAAIAPQPEEGYETQEILTRKTVMWFAIVHFGSIIATMILCFFLMNWFSKGIGPGDAQLPPGSPERVLPALPRLQADPHKDKEAMHIKDEDLHRYAVDKNGNVVRMPIEKAIELVAGENLPHRGGQ